MIVDLALKWPKKAQKSPKKPKKAEFLKLTCRPKKIQKSPLASPLPDHPPAKPTQPTRLPEPINGRLADG